MKNFHVALACALALSSAACLDAEEVDPSLEDGTPLPDDAVVYDTVATVSADGSVVMSAPRATTAAMQRAQNAVRMHLGEPVVAGGGYGGGGGGQDDECLADSFWLYSRTDYTGDRICFQGLGVYVMGDYGRFVMINGHPYYGTWRISSGSFIAGDERGELWALPPTGPYIVRTFDPYYAFYGSFQFAGPLTYIWLHD